MLIHNIQVSVLSFLQTRYLENHIKSKTFYIAMVCKSTMWNIGWFTKRLSKLFIKSLDIFKQQIPVEIHFNYHL